MRVISSALRPARSAARAICSRTRTSRSRICSAIARESYQRPSESDKHTDITDCAQRLEAARVKLKALSSRGKIQSVAVGEKREDLVVFILYRAASTCGECGLSLHKGDLIRLQGEKGALCLACADLDHLEFLPRGDAAVTRRSTKYSSLWAVVVQWSNSRKRYERQGVLADPAAIERALAETEADSEERARRREREAVRRERLDRKYIDQFAQAIRDEFPGIPSGDDIKIAEHACLKYSGRVGRSAAAKSFEPDAVFLAVQAHVRHVYTDYDKLLFKYDNRQIARKTTREKIDTILAEWRR